MGGALPRFPDFAMKKFHRGEYHFPSHFQKGATPVSAVIATTGILEAGDWPGKGFERLLRVAN